MDTATADANPATLTAAQWSDRRNWIRVLAWAQMNNLLNDLCLTGLTDAQHIGACRAISEFAEARFHGLDYEFKELTAQWLFPERGHGTLVIGAVTGRRGDEGTMASVLCRDRMLVSIGTRGGAKATGHTASRKAWSPYAKHGNSK